VPTTSLRILQVKRKVAIFWNSSCNYTGFLKVPHQTWHAPSSQLLNKLFSLPETLLSVLIPSFPQALHRVSL
jgi:hypothetical protein